MKSRTLSTYGLVPRLSERRAVVSVALIAVACAGDNVTRPNPISPAPAPPPPAHAVQFGSLVINVSTDGVDLDRDGYVLQITAADAVQSLQVKAIDSVRIDPIRAGRIVVELTEVAPNCWVGSGRQRQDSVRSNQSTTIDLTVSCESMSGAMSNAASFVGVWEARSWEFFRDPELTSSFEDVIAGGMAGTLTVRLEGGSVLQWQWRETYRWWGPDRPTLIWGHAEVGVDAFGFSRADALVARADSGMSEFECDWGDCDGPLHGEYRFVLTASRLVVTRERPIRYYDIAQPLDAWVRLVLERVQ